MREEIICAGFGGQGIILLGKLIARAALQEGRQFTWMPSYGAAMRGGCAFCMVVIADQPIASPYVDKCDSLFVFNQPSWHRFKTKVKRGGLVLYNSSLIKDELPPRGIRLRKIPFTEIASSLGEVRVANVVALGAFLREKDIFKPNTVREVLLQVCPKNKAHLLQINHKALEAGYQFSSPF